MWTYRFGFVYVVVVLFSCWFWNVNGQQDMMMNQGPPMMGQLGQIGQMGQNPNLVMGPNPQQAVAPNPSSFVGSNPRYRAVTRLVAFDSVHNIPVDLGEVSFMQYQADGPVNIIGYLTRMPTQGPRQLGLHVHELGNVADGCQHVGNHFNPLRQRHGAPNETSRHMGDLGNIDVMADRAIINIIDSQIKLVGPTTIIGRSLVLHWNTDDYGKGYNALSSVDGNSGPAFACGVIGVNADFSPSSAQSFTLSFTGSVITLFLCWIFLRL